MSDFYLSKKELIKKEVMCIITSLVYDTKFKKNFSYNRPEWHFRKDDIFSAFRPQNDTAFNTSRAGASEVIRRS
jgi:hypothetical protein